MTAPDQFGTPNRPPNCRPPQSGKACAVRFSREPQHQAADEAAGAYLLRTSHVDWDTERILRAYWELTEV